MPLDVTKTSGPGIVQVERDKKKGLLEAVQGAIERVNKMHNEALAGRLLSKLSNVEKQHVLSYGNVVGKHLGKSLK